MSILEWAALGAISLGVLIFCARIMRRGLTTLDDDRRHCMERIRLEERQLAEDRKNISAMEHMLVMRSALDDLLRLDGYPEGYSINSGDKYHELATPEGIWRIELAMREKNLRSTRRVIHGTGRWMLSGCGHYEQHPDPASLMRSLNEHLHQVAPPVSEPEHLARRLGAMAHKA